MSPPSAPSSAPWSWSTATPQHTGGFSATGVPAAGVQCRAAWEGHVPRCVTSSLTRLQHD